MNKEEREICELEDNFVSLIHKFIVSFPKLISGRKVTATFEKRTPGYQNSLYDTLNAYTLNFLQGRTLEPAQCSS